MSDALERAAKNLPVRVRALAEASGFPLTTIYTKIGTGEIEAIRLGHSVVVKASSARRLLGLPEPTEASSKTAA